MNPAAQIVVNALRLTATSTPRSWKRAVLLCLDAATVPVAFWVALVIGMDRMPGLPVLGQVLVLLCSMTLTGGLLSYMLGLSNLKLNDYDSQAMRRTVLSACTLAVWGYAIVLLVPGVRAPMAPETAAALSARFFVLFTLVFIAATILGRIAMRDVLRAIYRIGIARRRILIYGAGQTGVHLARTLRADPEAEVVGFVDDNPTLTNMIVSGFPVMAPTRLTEVVAEKRVDQIILAMPSLSPPRQKRLGRKLAALGCETLMIPPLRAHRGRRRARTAADPGGYLSQPVPPRYRSARHVRGLCRSRGNDHRWGRLNRGRALPADTPLPPLDPRGVRRERTRTPRDHGRADGYPARHGPVGRRGRGSAPDRAGFGHDNRSGGRGLGDRAA